MRTRNSAPFSYALTMGAMSRSACRARPSRPLMSRPVFSSTAALQQESAFIEETPLLLLVEHREDALV